MARPPQTPRATPSKKKGIKKLPRGESRGDSLTYMATGVPEMDADVRSSFRSYSLMTGPLMDWA